MTQRVKKARIEYEKVEVSIEKKKDDISIKRVTNEKRTGWSVKMETTYTFRRKERKYLIDSLSAKNIRDVLINFLNEKTFKRGTVISNVRSLYFDTYDFKCYFDHISGLKQRFKIRIRQYGYDDIYSNKCFVELKEKNNGITQKNRFKIRKKWTESFIYDYSDPVKLREYNNKMDYNLYQTIYSEIMNLKHLLELKPVVQISYNRISYENEEKTVRITFDSDLSFQRVAFSESETGITFSFPSDTVIMEIKTIGKRPYWIKYLLNKYHLKRQRFSKYCTAIETVYSDKTVKPEKIFLPDFEEELLDAGN